MKILALSPHTDDIELGAGGTLTRLVEDNEVRVITFSSCSDSLPEGLSSDTLKHEFECSMRRLGVSVYTVLEYPVRKLHEHRQEILELLVKVRNEYKPDLVIGPSSFDVHQDHSVVFNEMVRAFKTSSSIIGYELPWNHLNFEPRLFYRLDEKHVLRKCELLDCYRSQSHRAYFNPDIVTGQARMRATQCSGSKYAEAFEVIKWLR